MTKAYNLSKEDAEALSDIFDFLIFHGLATNCDVSNRTGSPAFLVPRTDPNKSKRLIVDTRKTNQYIDAPVSTPATNVLTEIQNLISGKKYLSGIDLSQAYYSIRLSEKTLQSNISNIYSGQRCIKLKCALTGTNFIPLFFNTKLQETLNLNDVGEFSPLNNRISSFASWFDDLSIASTSLENHKKAIELLIHRINRSKIKINLRKSFFFKDLYSDTIKLLGHQIHDGTVIPEAGKIKILKNFKSPRDRKSLQSFLGHLNFIRNLLPLQIIHLSTILTPLTSPTVSFNWEPHHEQCFQEIKSLLQLNLNYLQCPMEGSINILYSDSSESLLGGILFNYIPEREIIYQNAKIPILDILFTENNDLLKGEGLNIFMNGQFAEHIKHYSFNLGIPKLTYEIQDLPLFKCVVYYILTAIRWSQNKADQEFQPEQGTPLFLGSIFCHLTEIQTSISEEKFKLIVDNISNGEIQDKFFLDYCVEFLIILSIISRHNIKIIFGSKRVIAAPFFCVTSGFNQDILLGYCTDSHTFRLFYIIEDWSNSKSPSFTLLSNKNLNFSNCTEQEILKIFQDSLKNTSASKNIKIVGQFSKSISTIDMTRPIYIKEITSLLFTLEYFKEHISVSKLNLLVTDSKVAYFLFNQNVQRSAKKVERWSIKIAMSYPNVKIIHVTTKNNIADYLSRVGIPKKTFFAKTLTPVSLNLEVLDKIKKPFSSWEDIYNLAAEHPEVINFSEKKLPYNITDKYYIDSMPFDKNEEAKYNYLTLRKKFSILDSLINRKQIMLFQSKEVNSAIYTENNGYLTHHDKIVLPPSLYAIALVREHFLNAHAAPERIYEIINDLFHIENKKEIKIICYKMIRSCLACLLNNIKGHRYLKGMFKVEKRNDVVQMDFVEGLPHITYSLSIIDLYSGYITVYPLVNKGVNSIMLCVTNYISVHGNVNCIITDNYVGFKSEKLKAFAALHGIKLAESAPYISQGRSLVERCQRTYQTALRMFKTQSNQSWINFLPITIYLLNNRPFNHFVKITPHMLHFNSYNNTRDNYRLEQNDLLRTPLDNLIKDNYDNMIKEIEKIEKEYIKEKHRTREIRMDKLNKDRKAHGFQKDDIIILKRKYFVQGTVRKLRSPYNPIPFRVLKFNKFNLYLESLLDSSIIMRSAKDAKHVVSLTPDEIENFKVPPILLEQYSLITLDDLEDIFLGELREDIKEGVITRSRSKAKQSDTNNISLDKILEEYLEEDLMDLDFDKSVRFEEDQ